MKSPEECFADALCFDGSATSTQHVRALVIGRLAVKFMQDEGWLIDREWVYGDQDLRNAWPGEAGKPDPTVKQMREFLRTLKAAS